MIRSRIAILGADISAFHLFNKLYRSDDRYDVVCFFDLHSPIQSLIYFPPSLSGKLYPQGINILRSYPYKQSYQRDHKVLDQCVFSPSACASPQFLYSLSEFVAMDTSIVTHSLQSTQITPPKFLVSFFSNTQFDIPILLKILQMYKDKGFKPVIVMPGPLEPFTSKISDFLNLIQSTQFYFYIENPTQFEKFRYCFRYRHELEVIDNILKNGYQIYFVYNFEEFNSAFSESSQFDMIFFVAFNLMNCFYKSHLDIFVCDDFTFDGELTVHPSFVTCKQSNIVIYVDLESEPNSVDKFKENGISKIVVLKANYKAQNIDLCANKTAVLVDDSYPSRTCGAAHSISEFLCKKFSLKKFELNRNNQQIERNGIFGAPSNKNWPAIILPESDADVTRLNNELNSQSDMKFDAILSSTASNCGLKPSGEVKLIQFDFNVNLDGLTPELFE